MKRKPIILQDIWKQNIIEEMKLLHDYIDITKDTTRTHSEMTEDFINDCLDCLETEFYNNNEIPSVDWKYFILDKAQDNGILNIEKIMNCLPDCMEE